jgi:hypothetical protein
VSESSQQRNADVGTTLADLLCLPVAGEPVESRQGYLSDRVVKGAAALVDDSGLVGQWEQWYRDDHPDWATRGGRPGTVHIRAVLIVLVALAVSGNRRWPAASPRHWTSVSTPQRVTYSRCPVPGRTCPRMPSTTGCTAAFNGC